MIERSLKFRLRTKCLTQALSGRANCVDEDAEGGDKDEVLLAETPFGVDARGHWLRQIDRDAGPPPYRHVVLGAKLLQELGAVWPAVVVGVTVFFLVIVASIDLLSVVPANVYGYAALVAYSLHQPSAAPATGPLQNLVSPSFANPLVLLIVSMLIGALFGYASDQLAKVLPTKQPTMAAHA